MRKEGGYSGEEFIKDDSDAKDVTGLIAALALHDFGGQIGGTAAEALCVLAQNAFLA